MAEPLATLKLAARLEEMRLIAEPLRRLGAQVGLSQGDLIDLELAVMEAANNIVLHGYGGDGDAGVEVIFRKERLGLAVELVDRGVPIPEERLGVAAPSPLDAECGRGFGIIRACVDDLSYASAEGRNHLILVKQAGG